MSRRRVVILTAAAVVLALAAFVFVLSRQRVQRRVALHHAGRIAGATQRPKGIPPVEQWTQTFESLAPADLDALLDQIERQRGDLYAKYSLAYLHARARIENNDHRGAQTKLQPYVAAARRTGGRPLRTHNVQPRRKTGPSRTRRDPEQTKAIRSWANANGYDVSARGKISDAISDAYEAAH